MPRNDVVEQVPRKTIVVPRNNIVVQVPRDAIVEHAASTEPMHTDAHTQP